MTNYLLYSLASTSQYRSSWLYHFRLRCSRLLLIHCNIRPLYFVWILSFWTISLLLVLVLVLFLFILLSINRIRLLKHYSNWIGLLWNPTWLLNNLLNDSRLLSIWNLWQRLLNFIWDKLWLILSIDNYDLIWLLLVYILELLTDIWVLSLVEIRRHAYNLFLFEHYLRWFLCVVGACLLKALRYLLIYGVCLLAFAVSWIVVAVKLVFEQELLSWNQGRTHWLLLSLKVQVSRWLFYSLEQHFRIHHHFGLKFVFWDLVHDRAVARSMRGLLLIGRTLTF